MGSLIRDQQDASGLLYRRNRYYDPGTGRFTQEDPIGLAGGLNLYGYAAGDPINYSDPFGLCPNPVGWGSLQCELEAFVAGGKAAARAVVTRLGNNLRQSAERTASCLNDPVCAVTSFGAGSLARGGGMGRGFMNNRMLNNHRVAGKNVAVDAEFGGSGLGQVHVQIKGGEKILVSSADDLSRACYAPYAIAATARPSSRLTKARKCSPARVSGSRS